MDGNSTGKNVLPEEMQVQMKVRCNKKHLVIKMCPILCYTITPIWSCKINPCHVLEAASTNWKFSQGKWFVLQSKQLLIAF